MKKDNAKRKFAAKQSKSAVRGKWLWTVLACVMVVFISGIGFFSYYPINPSMNSSLLSAKVSSYYASANSWMTERKQRLHQNIEKVKQIAVNQKDANQDIHFEFYSALQNMQVSVPAASQTAIVHQPSTNNSITKLAENGIKPSVKAASDNNNVTGTSIFNAEKLQLALKNEFNQIDAQTVRENSRYVLQMGIFKNAAGAERLRASLVKSGFSVKVVKTALAGKEVYSVQIGPFITKNQAVLAQRQLQKKSVNGLVRKI